MTTLSGLIQRVQPTHIISYDLIAPESIASYLKLHGKIKSLGSWSTPLKSFWLVNSKLSCKSIVEALDLDDNDKLLVVNISTGAKASQGILSSELDLKPSIPLGFPIRKPAGIILRRS